MTDRVILDRALAKWGATHQMLIAIEEMAELITALCHSLRGRDTEDEVVEEVADVLITVKQMKILFGESVVNKFEIDKTKRLQERIDNEN
jgi:NTP pyrophosphatase (non-canonical NTP hydrolase)